MKPKPLLLITVILAGALNMTTAEPGFGQAVHGASIDGSSAAPPSNVTSNAGPARTGGIIDADFETLAGFNFNVPDGPTTNAAALTKVARQIPDSIMKLDGKLVRIRGFMMPVKESQGKTTEFLITRSQPSCCFSGATGVNEFVTVKMPGKGVDEDMDDAVAVEGMLHVGVETDSGYVTAIYSMVGQKMIVPGH